MASLVASTRKRAACDFCDACIAHIRPTRIRPHAHTTIAGRASSSAPIQHAPRRALLEPRRTSQNARHFRHLSTSLGTSVTSPEPAGLIQLTSRRLISLSGADAAKFLHGLVTNNVDQLSRSPFYTAFLDARGRVLWDVFIWPAVDEHWACQIEVDANEVESLTKHLRKHKLRSKITIRPVGDDELRVWADISGTQPEDLPLSTRSIKDPRSPRMGTRYLLDASYEPQERQSMQSYRRWRYINGVAEGQEEILRESALPMESNIDLSRGIDFRKGCYVGQELTIRTKHTGVVRKRILPIQLYRKGEQPPSAEPDEDFLAAHSPTGWDGEVDSGTDIKELDADGNIKKGRATGKFVAAEANLGLALCRLEMMTSWRVTAEGGSLRPGAEFGVQGKNGELIRIKSHVQPWMREREKELWDKGRPQLAK
ncbi:hypothetical protein BCR34DRAFT_579440 [Clohesyomyces aquaticus]|uniref:Iron-sulfur cluster assembly factor IBA57 homolog, mitochondrial n=1 Tax=Clohesyomyces aquaticus TaxID=1231657 RepID=A0A1Y1YB45_9PLEO|nr:hypothetical protein BCR34DRAFT_579440 [Clohesyomyces aquaticus]